MKTFTSAKASHLGGFRRHAAMSLCFALGSALLAAALSADSRAANDSGGFLYSDYLRTPESSATTEHFRVSSSRALLVTDGGQISERLDQAIDKLPLSTWILDDVNGGADLAPRLRDYAAQTGWGFARAGVEDGFSALSEGALLSGFVRNVDLDVSSELGGRIANVGLNAVGALRETDYDAVAWQLRGYKGNGDRQGFNIGGAYRWAVNNSMFGANLFADYETFDGEGLWRWSFGGEMRSAWVDAFANYYIPINEVTRDDEVIWTQRGYDVEFNVHAPEHAWLTGVLGYYFWDGANGEYVVPDSEGLRVGVKFSPAQAPVVFEVLYQSSDNDDDSTVGGKLMFFHEFGESRIAGSSVREFRPQNWFFAAAEREYTQRIQTSSRQNGWLVQSLDNANVDNFIQLTGRGTRADLRGAPDGLGLNIIGLLLGANVGEEGAPTSRSLPWQIPELPATVQIRGTDSDEVQISLTYSHGRVHVLADNSFDLLDLELSDNKVNLASGRAAVRGSDFMAVVTTAMSATISVQVEQADITMSQSEDFGIMMAVDGRVVMNAGSVMVHVPGDDAVFRMSNNGDGISLALVSGSLLVEGIHTEPVPLNCLDERSNTGLSFSIGVGFDCSDAFTVALLMPDGERVPQDNDGVFQLERPHTGTVNTQTVLASLGIIGGTGSSVRFEVSDRFHSDGSIVSLNVNTGELRLGPRAVEVLNNTITVLVMAIDSGNNVTSNVLIAVDIEDQRDDEGKPLAIDIADNEGRGFSIEGPLLRDVSEVSVPFATVTTSGGAPESESPRTYTQVGTPGDLVLVTDMTTTTYVLSLSTVPIVDTAYQATVMVETPLATATATLFVEVQVPLSTTLRGSLNGAGSADSPWEIRDLDAAEGFAQGQGQLLARFMALSGGSGIYSHRLTMVPVNDTPFRIDNNGNIYADVRGEDNEGNTIINLRKRQGRETYRIVAVIDSGSQSRMVTVYFRVDNTFIVGALRDMAGSSITDVGRRSVVTITTFAGYAAGREIATLNAYGGSCAAGDNVSYSVNSCVLISGAVTTTTSGACPRYGLQTSTSAQSTLVLMSGGAPTVDITAEQAIEATCGSETATVTVITHARDPYLVQTDTPTVTVAAAVWDGNPVTVATVMVSGGGGQCENFREDTDYEVMCTAGCENVDSSVSPIRDRSIDGGRLVVTSSNAVNATFEVTATCSSTRASGTTTIEVETTP